MTPELIAMIGGGASGFIFKLIGQLVANQQGTVDAMIKKQSAADESHQKASTRGGEWVRRVIVCTVLFAVVVAPFCWLTALRSYCRTGDISSLVCSRESSIRPSTDTSYCQRFVKQF